MGVPKPRRPWTSEDSSSERGEGDHDAFTELARDAVTRLDRVARLILRDPELARDAVQEALIRAWHDLPGLRDPDAVRRLAPSPDRQRLPRPRSSSTPAGHRGRARSDRLHRSVDDLAGSLADREIVDAAMRRLDEHGRAIVVLHYFLGMPLTEVAATLGVPIGTVKSRLHRALGEMRTAVETDADVPRRRSPEGRSHDHTDAHRARAARHPRRPVGGPAPDYLDDVFGRTGRMRQRPAWTLPRKVAPDGRHHALAGVRARAAVAD